MRCKDSVSWYLYTVNYMGEKRILIDGEEYISSARAAELVGYSKDYVGQLARGGKIDAKRVGRNWYIREASINKHKLSVHYTLTKPKKKEKSIHKSENTTFSIDTSPRLGSAVSTGQVHVTDQQDKNSTQDLAGDSFLHEELQKTKQLVNDVATKEEVHLKRDKTKVNDDLFPEIRKKQMRRDPLIQSDIRYEKNEIPSQMNAMKPLDSGGFRSVAVRKPVLRTSAGIQYKGSVKQRGHPKLFVAPSSKKQFSNISVDGVLPVKKKLRESGNFEYEHKKARLNYDSMHTNYEMSSVDVARKHNKKRPAYTVRKEQNVDFDENESGEFSKVVPVVGAIILFTIVVVVYLIFSV